MRQTNRFEREDKKNGALPGFIFLLVIFLFPMLLSRTVGLLVVVLVLAGLGFYFGRKFSKAIRRNAEENNTISFRPASPGTGKACPNPETHRHFETPKPCPNPEPHRHYSGGSQPLTQFEQDAAARKKRLENMKVLYNAGILTREEYDYEVRRIKKL